MISPTRYEGLPELFPDDIVLEFTGNVRLDDV